MRRWRNGRDEEPAAAEAMRDSHREEDKDLDIRRGAEEGPWTEKMVPPLGCRELVVGINSRRGTKKGRWWLR